MSADILLLFRTPHADVAPPSRERILADLLAAPGVVGARAFDINVILGDRPPAFHPELVIFELGGDPMVVGLRSEGELLGWEGTSIGVGTGFDLPEHLYLQFSAPPPSMSFEDYSDWYQVHQDENLAQTDALTRGWRFRLESLARTEQPGPTHLAAYEIQGSLETVTGDLGRAMQAGVISVPAWFTRFASLEAVAAGERIAA
ncbi:MAG: hypothetical protein ACRDLP_15610 [Solirubrobacteraceae bacterium]